MKRSITFLALTAMLVLSSCAKQESAEATKPSAEATQPGAEAPAAAQPAGGPHAIVHLKDGSKVPGTIVASSQTDMVVAGDDGIERKIPMAQVRSVVYAEAQPQRPRSQASIEPAHPKQQTPRQTAEQKAQAQAPAPEPLPPPAITTKTYELPVGSEVSVRTNETIDSATAAEGQTFDVQITRDAKDANGDVVIARGSGGRVVIKSASKGGRFHGASDLVLDLQSVTINGKQYAIDTADISQKGKSGVGVNRRTGEFTAGAGVLTQVLTQGAAIKVPVESVLTFKLDKPLKVTAIQ